MATYNVLIGDVERIDEQTARRLKIFAAGYAREDTRLENERVAETGIRYETDGTRVILL